MGVGATLLPAQVPAQVGRLGASAVASRLLANTPPISLIVRFEYYVANSVLRFLIGIGLFLIFRLIVREIGVLIVSKSFLIFH